jgi:hypothetical protein
MVHLFIRRVREPPGSTQRPNIGVLTPDLSHEYPNIGVIASDRADHGGS